MLLTMENVHEMADKLGYKFEDLDNLKKGECHFYEKYKKIKKLDNTCWITLNVEKPIPFKIERDNKRRKVWRQFVNCRNYALKYGEDRVKAIKKGMSDDLMVEIVSDSQFISQQIKRTTSPLSEENGFTKTLDKIADYILFTKFDNKEQEEEHIELKKEISRLESEKKTDALKDKLYAKKEVKKNTPYSKVKRLNDLPSHYSVCGLEEEGNVNSQGIEKPDYVVNYTRVDRQMERGVFDESMELFWERFSPSKPNPIPFYNKEPMNYKELAYSTMTQYISEIQSLKDKPFTPERAKVISNLKGEMKDALKILRKVIHFHPSISIDEVIPDDTWNYLSMRDTEIYRILLYNYSELYEKYKTKINTNMWALLRSFEELAEKTTWTQEQAYIVDLMLNYDAVKLEEIQEALRLDHQIEYEKHKLSRIINKQIPQLLADTYEKQLEDWIWIHRRKGTYKKCSRCGEIKLAVDSRYFNKDSKGLLGLKSVCKCCTKASSG